MMSPYCLNVWHFIVKCFVIIFCWYWWTVNVCVCTCCVIKLINTHHYAVLFISYCLDQTILSVTVTVSHLHHYLRATLVVLYHPNVCSTSKQTFSSPYCKIYTESVLLDCSPIELEHMWDPVTLFSFLPTALTAWIKSTVTCVTTSPILLQT